MSAIDWEGAARQPCPSCGRGPKDRTCGVTIEHDRRGVAHCYRCDYVETRRGERRQGSTHQRVPAVRLHETLSDFGRALWDASRPLAGDAVAYLEARACVVPPSDGDLRWHPALPHAPSGLVGPALVALVTDAVDCRPLTLHRTWIRADGTKAPLDPPRMLLAGHRKTGGVVRLWADEDAESRLGLAEGIETALSLAHAFQPVWSTIDAGNLGAMPRLNGITTLMISADHDAAGISAARVCAARWAADGCRVKVVMPSAAKTDMNDLARAA